MPIFNVYKVFHNANPICIQMAGGKNDGENLEHFWETGRIGDYLEICREKESDREQEVRQNGAEPCNDRNGFKCDADWRL